MFEIARFLAATTPKVKKARKPAAKAIRVGADAVIKGVAVTIAARDTRYANAWFADDKNGVRLPYSFSRDMITVL